MLHFIVNQKNVMQVGIKSEGMYGIEGITNDKAMGIIAVIIAITKTMIALIWTIATLVHKKIKFMTSHQAPVDYKSIKSGNNCCEYRGSLIT